MNLKFEDVAGAQALHGDVLHAEIAIKRRAARDFRIEILAIVGRGDDEAAIRLAQTHVSTSTVWFAD